MTAAGAKLRRVDAATMDTVVAILRQQLGERIATGEAIRRQHASTLTWIAAEPPDAVVWPVSEAEIADIVRLAAEHGVPIVAFGAGTSLEGHVNAPCGGLSLDLSRMDRVIAVHAEDLDCTVEPGVSRKVLNSFLRDTGLFFAVDPGAGEATLGGMAATRASGTNAMRYGTMRDNVVSLRAVLADGSVISTGGRARKSAAGYDLTRLLVGSEGTLGIITELTVRLHPIPETIVAAVCPFSSVLDACNATIAAVQTGLGVSRIELLDAVQIRAVNAYAKLGLEEAPTLFVELHGSAVTTAEALVGFREIALREGAHSFASAGTEAERNRLWQARHDAYWANRAVWAGKSIMATDVCVPISRLADCVAETEADLKRLGLTAPIVGHVGDGNFHTTPVFDMSDSREMAALEEFLDRLAARAVAMEGTCTGEHGVGQGKVGYLVSELGAGVEVMRMLKAALDPQGILNPGKIF